jgi:hypothetical protein
VKNRLPLIAVFLVLAVGTWYHGVMTERWRMRSSADLDRFTKLVPQLPLKIGDWEGTEDEIDEETFKQTNCTAYVQRTYRHAKTGQLVSLYLVSGSGRNITVHSPDWCYRAAGFMADSDPVTYKISSEDLTPDPEFATAVFRKIDKQTGASNVLRIFWTYSMDGKWRGPKWAKLVLTRYAALYKVYVMYNVLPGGEAEPSKTPIPQFVQDTFATLNQTLFPDATKSASAEKVARQTTGP